MIGGLGVQELLIVLFIAFVLFGGKRLPEIGQNLGKAIKGFKEGSEDEPEDAAELKQEATKVDEAKIPESEQTEGDVKEDTEEKKVTGEEPQPDTSS